MDCVLQEAKLAALASKRWEHQKVQCVQTGASRDFMVWAYLQSSRVGGPRENFTPPIEKKEQPWLSVGAKGVLLAQGALIYSVSLQFKDDPQQNVGFPI